MRLPWNTKPSASSGGKAGEPGAPVLTRNQYKQVWNSVSRSEDDAKIAVSGHKDEELYRTSGEDTRDLLIKTVGLKPEDVVLEIGAGVGRVGAIIAPMVKEWIGCDVSENMVSHIRKRLAHLPNVRAVAVSGYDLKEIASESVDVVYCTVVFMHLDEWDRYSYIREGFRVLRPGGRMLVDNVDLTSEGGWKFFEDHRAIPPANRPPHISKTSTPDELRAYFDRAGFIGVTQLRMSIWVYNWGQKPA
jgi:SAM-dependent methyltransferase